MLEIIGLSNNFKELAWGNIDIPIINDGYNNVNKNEPIYFFPPMVVPFFVDYSIPDYKGIILHPLTQNRSWTFIQFDIESNLLLEIARNEKQFLTLMILEMVMIKDGLTPDIIEFCRRIGYNNENEVDRFSEKHGDNTLYFNSLVYFDKNLPLTYCQNISQYDGDFPSSNTLFNLNSLNHTTMYEVNNQSYITSDIKVPIWIKNENASERIFNIFLDNGEYEKAWFTLNGVDWQPDRLKKCLQLLNQKAGNELLNLITENWLRSYQYFKF